MISSKVKGNGKTSEPEYVKPISGSPEKTSNPIPSTQFQSGPKNPLSSILAGQTAPAPATHLTKCIQILQPANAGQKIYQRIIGLIQKHQPPITGYKIDFKIRVTVKSPQEITVASDIIDCLEIKTSTGALDQKDYAALRSQLEEACKQEIVSWPWPPNNEPYTVGNSFTLQY